MIVSFDCDFDVDNQVRMLHRAIGKPGLSLRALRQALWYLGMERSREEIIALADKQARGLGRPQWPQYTVGMPPGTDLANAKIKPKGIESYRVRKKDANK